MKKCLLIFCLILLNACQQKEQLPQWYDNGNLHQSTLSDWVKATEENRLATCADFAAKIKTTKGEKYNSIEEMKYDAIKLKSCIDEVAKNPDNHNQPIIDMVVGCEMIEEVLE